MYRFKKSLSLIISCIVASMPAFSPAVCADSANRPIKHYTTKSAQSKEKTPEPFHVFDIYNAYYGITTTKATTTKPKTTTTKATTTKPKTTTTKATTTVKPTTTTKTTIATTSQTTIETTTPTTTAETTTTSPQQLTVYNGIDVSEHQKAIDWKAVKESGVDFAIIRAGYGREISQEDPYFKANIEGAQKEGISVGIYWYSYADDTASAKREADTCYEVIKDYTFDLPLYFDIEEPKHAKMTAAQTSAIVDTFCSEMENRGYFVGLYSYANFLQTHLYKSILEKYDVWVAQYNAKLTAYTGNYSIWQYSSKGQVDGINGDVDVNYCYRDFSEVIQSNPNPVFVPPETTTHSTAEPLPETTTTRAIFDIVNADTTEIDWGTVNSEIAMLAVNNSGEEPDFDILAKNIDAAKAESRKIGVIWYADKTTPEELAEDAEKLHSFLEGYQFEYPVYLDLTNPAITESELTSDEISALIRAFCSVFDSDKKHYIAVRGYDDSLTDKVNADIYKDYDVWLVTDDDTIRFGYKYGTISRLISDSDNTYYENEFLRDDYPSVMIEYHLNGF